MKPREEHISRRGSFVSKRQVEREKDKKWPLDVAKWKSL